MKLYPKDRRALLEAAMGRRPCDLAVENVRFVNVFTGEIYPAVVYVLDGFVAYVEEGGRAGPGAGTPGGRRAGGLSDAGLCGALTSTSRVSCSRRAPLRRPWCPTAPRRW